MSHRYYIRPSVPVQRKPGEGLADEAAMPATLREVSVAPGGQIPASVTASQRRLGMTALQARRIVVFVPADRSRQA
jgi:hypothetical protein